MTKRPKIGPRFYLRKFATAILLFGIVANIPALGATKKANLLLICSYNQNFPTFYQQVEGIRTILPDPTYNLDVEFMDSSRFPGPAAEETFRQELIKELAALPKYDLVFTADDNALRFMGRNKNNLFPGTPVVFLGVNNTSLALNQNNHPNITGVIEPVSIRETIELAQQLQPQLKSIFAITDTTMTGRSDQKEFFALQSQMTELRFHELNMGRLSWDNLGIAVSSLPPNSALLLLSSCRDQENIPKTFYQSLSFILTHTKTPVFHPYEHGIGYGILGGVVTSQVEQGKAAARIAKEVLDGKDIRTIEVVTNSSNRAVADYEILSKYQIPLKLIPPSVELLNHPSSFYRENTNLVWNIAVIFLIMTGFILALCLNIILRHRTEKKLRRSQQLFEALFNESFQCCVILSIDGKIITPNDSSLESIQATAEEVEGKDLWDTPWWKGLGYDKKLKDAVTRAAQGESVRFMATYQTVTKGKIIVDFSLKPIMEQSEVMLLIAESRDITELRRMQETLKQNEKMEAIGLLAGGVAHDFNNMLSGILGFAELLADRLAENPILHGYAHHIISTAQRAALLTGQLLSFARKGKKVATCINVRDIINDTILLLERSIDKKISISAHFDTTAGFVTGDPGQIQNAILNLGVNARDAMPRGGTLTITTKKRHIDEQYCDNSAFDLTAGNFVQITVCDTGTGIPDKFIERIFEPFFTTKEIGRGTGLGLAAVYGVVTDHHGEITVSSQMGHGTTFEILLPLSIETAVEPAPVVKPIAPPPGNNLILVIDDEPVIRTLTQAILKTLGHPAIVAENGYEGLKIYQQHKEKIALCIIDAIMPKMNGMETLQKIKAIDPTAKIIIASGFSADSTMHDFLDAGAAAFLVKPYNQIELSTLLQQQLSTT